MKRIYYEKETGYLCDRYPKDIEKTDDSPYIEVEDDIEDQTYCVDYGKAWKVVNGSLVIADDIETQESEEYKAFIKRIEIDKYKQYLTQTDYVITKLNEAKIEDETLFESLKIEYADVLTKRKKARAKINELELS